MQNQQHNHPKKSERKK
uniref:Uncharacterized protein n=1 Tax=Rhizophora mucronata TaxID=61149 RepID=A0A2P2QVG4_RHIMU